MPRRVEDRPLKQHQAKTVFLRCPTGAWPLISTGTISEFRAAAGNAPQLWKTPLPTLAVVFRRQPVAKRYDYRLMVLQAIRQEALGTISTEGLERAGYAGEDARARFRRDWMIEEKKRFEPLRVVFVYTVKPVALEDVDQCALSLVEHLYGEYVSDLTQRTIQVR